MQIFHILGTWPWRHEEYNLYNRDEAISSYQRKKRNTSSEMHNIQDINDLIIQV